MASTGAITLILGVLCFYAGAATAQRRCSSGYHPIQDECFKLVTVRMTVEEAKAYCEFDDATLASMSTVEQKEEVVNFVSRQAPGQYWTSGRDINGRSTWAANQEQINPRFKGRNFRANTCVYLCSHTRMLWDRPCVERLGFICQQEAEFHFVKAV